MKLKEIAEKHLATWELYDADKHTVSTRNCGDYIYLGYSTAMPSAGHCAGKRGDYSYFSVNIINGVFFILEIAVEPQYRGKGHGDALYLILESIAADCGCHRVQMMPSGWTSTGESRMDYLLRRGYRKFGTEVVKDIVPAAFVFTQV